MVFHQAPQYANLCQLAWKLCDRSQFLFVYFLYQKKVNWYLGNYIFVCLFVLVVFLHFLTEYAKSKILGQSLTPCTYWSSVFKEAKNHMYNNVP